MSRARACKLKLSNGAEFAGRLIGAPVLSRGEVVFTTAMTGYSEAITDPSFFGQILVFSYPLIGNYGIPAPGNPAQPPPPGYESHRAHLAAVIVGTDSEEAYHWSSAGGLDAWLHDQGVPGIAGVDTRALVREIRNHPGLLGRVEPESPEGERAPGLPGAEAGEFFDPGAHLVLDAVSTRAGFRAGRGKTRIGLIDCGVKWNIVRELIGHGCEVEVVPWTQDLKAVDCAGWVLSNGPGDPARTGDLVSRVAGLLLESRPVLGICLGHQILALGAGAATERMRYGHRGHNHPVRELATGRGFLTSQNHGYMVGPATLPEGWEAWFTNANDGTSEGIRHRERPFRSVQFHPEAAGGPRDTRWILEDFARETGLG